jgi:aspartyl-tRNA(Asn)/glutamyl-tRNA(Gln) amidotransferase subunit A
MSALSVKAKDVVAGIKTGNISCEELLWKIYERIEKSQLNCFITLNKDDALTQAREVDKKRSDNDYHNKKLLGVPIAIKDCISTHGIQTTCASKILLGYVPPYNATVVEALKKEGAIIIGKTNMDEFCMGSSTETSYFGTTRNPYDLSRVPGGSSGGSAAALAADETVLALGSDTGGSIRCPASFCGIVGLKPTYGLVSRYGLIAYANSLEQIGPMATNVEDVALLLEVIAAKDDRDSTQINNTTIKRTINPETDERVQNGVKVKIGVPREFIEGVSPDVEKSVWNAIHKYEELGRGEGGKYVYEEISMPNLNLKHALASYYIIAMSEASSNLARFDGLRYGLRIGKDEDWHTTFSRIRGEGFGEEVKRRIILGTYALSAGYYGKYYLKALKVRTLIKKEFETAFKNVDVLAMPTMPFVAFKIGGKKDPLSLYLADVNTVPINLAGVPSISIPCGFSNGLPIGLQLVGRHFEEGKILNVAQLFI